MKIHLIVMRVFEKAQTIPLPFWVALIITLPLTTGTFGVWLLHQKNVGECETAKTSPDISDSTRLYCAQMSADRQTADDLLEAIQLANAISYEHPLRTDGDRLIERWSNQVLELAETLFQDGKLNEAIALLEKIPVGTPVYEFIRPRIQEWQATWQEAATIYDDAQTALQDDKPTVALAEARKLLRVPNQYWRTTRFQELAIEIQATRENRKKAASQQQKTPKEAISQQPLTAADLLSNWQKEQAVEASIQLARARELAAPGDVNSLRKAISAAELVFSGTPQYPQAQQAIAQWTRQIETIEDRPYLDRATKLASKGDLTSLQAAISEANNIYFGRALYQEAQSKIDQWTNQARQIHDQQYSQQNSTLPTNQFRETDYRIPLTPVNP
ncbi:hypothetical protein OsccyDRAFT_1284 [Leptolyngbyaceae cyanobacterium JSC-12]|nr:hypothetical protein OsccyDRAFT_1284 [Leptolyngbyaceae cyanobacterium JSC-12]